MVYFSLSHSFVAISLASIASAHFILNFPTSRTFDEDKEAQFCGGFPSNSTGRHLFPLSGSVPVTITSTHSTAQVAILISFKTDPLSFVDFNTSDKVNYVKAFETIKGQGDYCFTIDIAKLTSQLGSAPANGSLATLMVEYNGGDHPLFQCSDLILVQNYTLPNNVTCKNPNSATNSSSTSSSTSSTSSNSTSVGQGAKNSGVEKICTQGLLSILATCFLVVLGGMALI